MLMQASGRPTSAHVIVLGNEKGGAGKSTIAMHLARCAAQSRSAGGEHRSRSAPEEPHALHRKPARVGQPIRQQACCPYPSLRLARNDARPRRQRGHRVHRLRRRAHRGRAGAMISSWWIPPAPTIISRGSRIPWQTSLITPLNDSFLDFDVLATVDRATYAVTGESHYAKMVREARQQRRLADGCRWTGWWCATVSRCSIPATSSASSRDWAISRPARVSQRAMRSPNG